MRRALLTGVSQLSAKISEYNAEQLDTDVVEVTAHAGARPEHAAWQGGWYSLTGKDKRYKDLRTETGYGTGAGLMGWNCRHTFFPVIPGIDEPKYTKEQLENIDPPPVEIKGKTYTYYEAEQRQRFIERSMRELRREIYAAQASGDEQQYKARVNYLRLKTTQYVELCKDAGLLPRPQRYGAIGVGRVVSKEANWSKVIGNNALNSLRTAPKTAKKERPAVINVPGGTNGGTGKIYQSENLTKKVFSDKINIVENTLAIKQQEPFDIHSSVLDTNPNYLLEEGYATNCQRCILAYEMRRRGYDVKALPAPAIIDLWGNECFSDINGNSVEYTLFQNKTTIMQILSNAPEGARYGIYVQYDSDDILNPDPVPHVFIAEKSNGNIMFIDPQTGELDVSYYMDIGIDGQFGYLRMDNKLITNSETLKTMVEAYK